MFLLPLWQTLSHMEYLRLACVRLPRNHGSVFCSQPFLPVGPPSPSSPCSPDSPPLRCNFVDCSTEYASESVVPVECTTSSVAGSESFGSTGFSTCTTTTQGQPYVLSHHARARRKGQRKIEYLKIVVRDLSLRLVCGVMLSMLFFLVF